MAWGNGTKDPDNPRCGAALQSGPRKGEPCQRYPLKDCTRCGRHGGASPNAQATRFRNRIEGKALVQLARLTPDPVSDPLTALSALAGEITQWKDLMAQWVADLRTPSYSSLEGEQIRGTVQLYERALDRAMAALATIAKLNIDERLAAINERQAAQVERALSGALDALNLPPAQRTLAERELTRHLRIVA